MEHNELMRKVRDLIFSRPRISTEELIKETGASNDEMLLVLQELYKSGIISSSNGVAKYDSATYK